VGGRRRTKAKGIRKAKRRTTAAAHAKSDPQPIIVLIPYQAKQDKWWKTQKLKVAGFILSLLGTIGTYLPLLSQYRSSQVPVVARAPKVKVTLISPPNNLTVPYGATVNFTSVATSSDAEVTLVSYSVNGHVIGAVKPTNGVAQMLWKS